LLWMHVCFCCVCFSFSVLSQPRDWLGRTYPKLPILYGVGLKTVPLSIICWLLIIHVMCILDRISTGSMNVKFTYRIQAPGGSTLDVGVKTEDDLKQWVDAIRNCAQKPLVCTRTRQLQ